MIKIIAFLTMFIDHIGQTFFPNLTSLVGIGRLAFPLFAWGIALGVKYTSNFKQYVLRLFLLAIISQVPYYLLFHNGHLNVLFTLLCGLIVLKVYESKIRFVYKWFTIILMILLADILQFEYGIYGVFTIIIFYSFREKLYYAIFFQSVATLIFMDVYYYSSLQLVSVLAGVIILVFNKYDFKLHRLVQYSFYPVHMVLLLLIYQIVVINQ